MAAALPPWVELFFVSVSVPRWCCIRSPTTLRRPRERGLDCLARVTDTPAAAPASLYECCENVAERLARRAQCRVVLGPSTPHQPPDAGRRRLIHTTPDAVGGRLNAQSSSLNSARTPSRSSTRSIRSTRSIHSTRSRSGSQSFCRRRVIGVTNRCRVRLVAEHWQTTRRTCL